MSMILRGLVLPVMTWIFAGCRRVQATAMALFVTGYFSANSSIRRFIRVVLRVFTANQIEIHQQRAWLQAKFENFVRKGERVRHRRY